MTRFLNLIRATPGPLAHKVVVRFALAWLKCTNEVKRGMVFGSRAPATRFGNTRPWSLGGRAGELHTRRWRIVVSVAQSQAQGAQAALAALRRRALACDQTQQRCNQWTSTR